MFDDFLDILPKAIIIIIILLALIISPIYAYSTKSLIECKVESKERINKAESSKYLIFCEDKTLENTDSLWYWKWNSSDMYGKIKEGETYTFNVYGWRVPILSWYKNIISIE